MFPGETWSVEVGGRTVTVFYKKHFVERVLLGELPIRRPVIDFLTVEQVRDKIEEAIPIIEAQQSLDSEMEGVIESRSLHLNMVFKTRPQRGGFLLTMKSAMVKEVYVPTGLKDYVIRINPAPARPLTMTFPRGLGRELREFAVTDILENLDEMADGTAYHRAVPEWAVEYWVVREGDRFFVDDATWTRDMLIVQVA